MGRPERLDALAARAYAHRGLHDQAIPENSLAAFRAAIAAGLGIECDIRLSSDGRAMVFHDAGLERLTSRSGRIDALPVGALAGTVLKGSTETIPTLRDMLALVAGRVPLLIEIKSDDRRPVKAICRAVRRDLDGYAGAVGVMSFDPRVPRWFARHVPGLPAGLVLTQENARTLLAGLKKRLLVRFAAPDFLALDIRDLPGSLWRSQRARGRMLFSWTVRSAEQVATARACGVVPILEGAGVQAWRQGDGQG